MSEGYMADVGSLKALINGSFPTNLSKLSSTSLTIPTDRDSQILYNSEEFNRPIDEIAQTLKPVLQTIGDKKSMRFVDGDGAYEWLVKVNDKTLEKFDECIGLENSRAGAKIDVKLAESDKKFVKHGKTNVPFHMPMIQKPQEEYKILVDNANKPFEHVFLEKSDDGLLRFVHPLEKLSVMEFVDKNLSEMTPVKPLPLEETPFKYVEEVKDLEDLAAKLQSVDEFAVDLEHNQYRSFQGLTCLMQISTRTEDYIVDTFKLWDHIGPYLREVFKDPKKKKVMHGADRDVIWLQRDFGIYVCNLFDTGQASRVLKMEKKSLEFLLNHYCGVAANKQYQNADWRIRPLPDVMTRYAREDTHYLLYIYDVMRIDLHTMAKEDEESDSPLIEVYKRSYDVCTQLYEKELLTGDSYLHVNEVQAGYLNAVQLSIVAGLWEWRDQIARANDESTGYVLPNKTLLNIAKEMPFKVGQLRQLLKSKLPYLERYIDTMINVIRRSMQNAAAFEPVVQSLKDWRHGILVENNIEPRTEKTGTKATASSPGLKKFCVDDTKKQNSDIGALSLKRKFESDNKVKEEVKVSKPKLGEVPITVTVGNGSDERSSKSDDASNKVSETRKGSVSMTQKPKTCDKEIIVIDDETRKGSVSMTQKPRTCDKEIIVIDDDDEPEDDSESREDEDRSRRSEKHRRFMNMKRGFLNI